MPILATGKLNRPTALGGARAGRRWGPQGSKAPAQRGFTLLEIMVVVFIIGIMMGFVVISMDLGGGKRELEREATRLVALLELAAQESVLQGRDLALELGPGEYRFMVQDGDAWASTEDDEVLRPRNLPEGMRLHLYIEGEEVTLRDPQAAAEADEDETRVYFLSSGEVTPFELVLSKEDVDVAYHIKAELDGKLGLEGT